MQKNYNKISLAHLPEAFQSKERAGIGIKCIQDDGSWVIANDTSGVWKLVFFIGTVALLASFVWLLPGDDNPPKWIIYCWTVCGLAFAAVCFAASIYLRCLNPTAAVINPDSGTVTFSRKKGEPPASFPLASCFIHISQQVVARSKTSYAPAGLYPEMARPDFVNIEIGSKLKNEKDTQFAVVASGLPYKEVAEGIAQLTSLGTWAGVAMCDHTALRDTVMQQVQSCINSDRIYVPERAAACMSGVISYHVYEP